MGITESHGRHGTVISEGASVNQDEELADVVAEFARRIETLGVSARGYPPSPPSAGDLAARLSIRRARRGLMAHPR